MSELRARVMQQYGVSSSLYAYYSQQVPACGSDFDFDDYILPDRNPDSRLLTEVLARQIDKISSLLKTFISP